jgi:hypothetical protein
MAQGQNLVVVLAVECVFKVLGGDGRPEPEGQGENEEHFSPHKLSGMEV